jgi:hypothetical protein
MNPFQRSISTTRPPNIYSCITGRVLASIARAGAISLLGEVIILLCLLLLNGVLIIIGRALLIFRWVELSTSHHDVSLLTELVINACSSSIGTELRRIVSIEESIQLGLIS